MVSLHLPDPEATRALGRRLGELAGPDTFLALDGALGAGKTALVKGLGEGLGATSVVQSPTFVLLQVHQGRLVLWHADFYRLRSASEVDDLGLDDLDGGVIAVEWASRFPSTLPPDRLEITIEDDGAGRRATVVATGPVHAPLEAALDPS